LQKELASLKEKKVRVVGISYDTIDVLSKFSEQQKITFPLLSDPDSDTIKAFQLMNAEAKEKIEGVPYPGTVILDKHGTIQAKLFYDGYRERHAPTDILKAVSEIK
jgi:peroxiredoxin